MHKSRNNNPPLAAEGRGFQGQQDYGYGPVAKGELSSSETPRYEMQGHRLTTAEMHGIDTRELPGEF